MNLWIERAYPHLTALTCGVLWWGNGVTLPAGDGVLSASLTIGAILTGFLATAKAILITLDTPAIQRLRNAGFMDLLAAYLGHAILYAFLFCGLGLLGFFDVAQRQWFGLLWAGIGGGMVAAFARIMLLMLKVFRLPS